MLTIEEMATEIIEKAKGAGYDLHDVKDTPQHRLIHHHNGLGTTIRNHFKLWSNEWVPDIVDGIDMSIYHPDHVSMEVIYAIWSKLNERTN
jgi:hypothetical protein